MTNMKRLVSVVFAAAVVVGSAFAHDANADFKKFLTGMLPKVVKAFETKNVKFFDSISTADFTETEMGKTMNKAESMAGMSQMFKSAKTIKCSFKLDSSSVKGDTGTAMTSGRMTAIMNPTKPKGKPSTMVADMWMKETWVKDGKGWKIKHIDEAKPSKMTMDGKPFDPSKMGGPAPKTATGVKHP